jgi:autotransporter-associated beta strand protein
MMQPNGTPYTNTLSGALLDIKGVISGFGGLTKQGFDTVTLSGANTYVGTTNVIAGALRIGANNALPTTGTLQTRGDAVFDLNGFNQTIGRLTSPTAAVQGLNVMGFIGNSATTLSTLTVGSGSTGNANYGGVIQGNIALAKTGNSALILSGSNTYVRRHDRSTAAGCRAPTTGHSVLERSRLTAARSRALFRLRMRFP